MIEHRLNLFIDADDTLWENNIYFERAIEEFLDFLAHSTLSRAEARAALNEIERANTHVHGYGARAFAQSLQDCYAHLHARHLEEHELGTIMDFAGRILSQEIELLPGVEETLRELSTRHHLTIFTKGHEEDQRMKIANSGLGDLFAHHAIVAEKNTSAYHALVATVGSDPARTWMIGNSPKSDINPALDAGLGAVFIPHDHTWQLEHASIAEGGDRLIVLERFSQLLDHF